jgi:hypothetical protein
MLAAGMAVLVLLLVTLWHMDRSAWYDEAWVVDYLSRPTPAATLRQCVQTHRPAAVGYVLAMWPIAHLPVQSLELFRLPTAVATVLLLVAAASLGRAWSGLRTAGWLAAVFLLACPLLQRYVTEVKQYATEATLTVCLIAATQWWATTRRWPAAATWLALALLCLVGTFSAWFAVAACGLTIFACWLRPIDKRQIVVTLAFGAIIAAVAAAVHLGFNRHIAGSGQVQDSWAREFIPLSADYPRQVWIRLAQMLQRGWYTLGFPEQAVLGVGALGWLVWLRRQPVSAAAAALTVAITVAANAAGVWPLGLGARVRINLPLLTLLNLCLLALPLGVLGMLINRRCAPASSAEPNAAGATPIARTCKLEWVGLAMVTLLAAWALRESRQADYEVAQARELLRRAAQAATPADRVVLEETTDLNRRYMDLAIPGDVVVGAWPGTDILRDYLPLALKPGAPRVYFLAGHHNEALQEHWKTLMAALQKHGQTQQAWTGRLVALYVFTPGTPGTPGNPGTPGTPGTPAAAENPGAPQSR